MAIRTDNIEADLLLKGARLLDGVTANIAVLDGNISFIGQDSPRSKRELDCKDLIVAPSLNNAHTHSAMTLFRGWGDDMPLHEWLHQRIWPAEAHMTDEDVYAGAMLACLEMISTGTTFFNDMYWHPRATIKAARDMGMKACINSVLIDAFNPQALDVCKDESDELMALLKGDKNVRFALGPHAPYTVSEKGLKWCSEYSAINNVPIHIHLNETEREVSEFVKARGVRPIEYLADIGFLSERVFAAHCIWLSDREVELLAKYRCKVLHLPTSNLKLASGEKFFLKRLTEAGVTVLLGTDGCASNNNLDMFEEMKFAALLQKSKTGDPLYVNAADIFHIATTACSDAFRLGGGVIREGASADLMLIDGDSHAMIPCHNAVSNIVYSANGGCVRGVICDGKVLMWNGIIEGAWEIINKARNAAKRVCAL